MPVQLRQVILLSWVATMAVINPVEAEEGAAPPVINYLVVDNKVGPFQMIFNDRSDGGIISDIVDQIFAGTELSVRHTVLPVNRLTFGVSQDHFDNWIAFDAPVWDSFGGRGEYTRQPLLVTRHIMLTCNPDIASPVSSLEELRGMSLATLRNFRYLALDVAAKQGLVRLVPVDNFNIGLALVSLGRVDGFVEMQSRLRFYLNGYGGDRRCMREVDFSAIIPNYPVYLTMDRRLPESIKALINERLWILEQTGELSRIWNEYVPTELPTEIRVKANH